MDQLLRTSSPGSPEFIPSPGGCVPAALSLPIACVCVRSCVACHAQLPAEEREEEALPNWRKGAKSSRSRKCGSGPGSSSHSPLAGVMFRSIQIMYRKVPRGLGIINVSMMAGRHVLGMPWAAGDGPLVWTLSADRIALAPGFQTFWIWEPPAPSPMQESIQLIQILFCSWHLSFLFKLDVKSATMSLCTQIGTAPPREQRWLRLCVHVAFWWHRPEKIRHNTAAVVERDSPVAVRNP